MKNAFSMIELVFVIVILGILAAIAIPKFSATRDDAQIAKGRANVASIRSGIITERQSRLITGDSAYITGISLNGGGLFGGVLMYPLASGFGDGKWATTGTDSNASSSYTYTTLGVGVAFIYTQATGKFDCNTTTGAPNVEECRNLVN